MAVIDSGYIKNMNDSKYYTYEMIMLNETHLQEVVDLHQRILKQLDSWELCVTITPEEFQSMLGTKGMLFGIFVEKTLIAFRAVLFPEDLEENLGPYIGLQKWQFNQVVHLEVTNVHPDFRGNGLQKKMLVIALEMLRQIKKHRHIFTIASPQNYPSVHNIFSVNMLLIDIQKMYNGRLRYIFYKDLRSALSLDFNSMQMIPVNNIVKQKKLLEAGYVGFRLNREGLADTVSFAKRTKAQYRFDAYNMLG
ncbi:hypothetical protein SAMN05660297_01621 [Natronincola peptidivorans]|uniref:N-acetyltransferase domain-containing protein n=1 Tax=Natronincola peptidivorans TaxID=426128 RepID=A0A1I0CEU3_9FIRM|nr:hypothetical protein [Natronincola peptidivorans]SET17830.1 hypothetical protein SAMN05660297_01621 [Natronincola peptidivorans]